MSQNHAQLRRKVSKLAPSDMHDITLQIREQILVPDLYVLTVESVAYKKKRLKREKKNF